MYEDKQHWMGVVPLWPTVGHRRRATADVRTVQNSIDGVEFLSLPPLCYRQGDGETLDQSGLRR